MGLGRGNSMELIDVRSFEAAARTGSLTRAGKELHVAQPAVSRRMRALERELGVELLTRHVRGVTPTPAGASFAEGGRVLLQEVSAALDRAEETAAGRRGRVVLAVTRAVVARGFPAEVQESLRAEFPQITVVIDDQEQPAAAEAVALGRADLGVCFESAALPGVAAEPLWVETLDSAILPRDHALAGRSAVTLEELATTPFVFARGIVSEQVRDRVGEALGRAGLRSPLLPLEDDLRIPHLAVAAGRGWTLISRSRAGAPPDGTAVVQVQGLAIAVNIMAVWRRDEQRPVVHTVLRAMRDVAHRYDGPTVRPLRPSHRPPEGGRRARRPPGTVPPGVALGDLRALVMVAAAGSIGAAAAQVGITQPALSRRLSELEHAVGLTLLVRSPRGVVLTPAGKDLAAEAPALLAAADRLIGDATRARRGIEGRCVIGAVATAASGTLLRQATECCAARYPQIDVVIQEIATPRQRNALLRGDIDLGVAHAFAGTVRTPGLVGTRIVDDPLDTALLVQQHPLALEREIDAGRLADIPFLFMARSSQPDFHDRVMATLAALGLRPRVDATHDGLQTVWALVAQGRGWTIGFHSHLTRAPLGTVAVPIRGFRLASGLELLSRKGESSPLVQAVLSVFRDLRRGSPASAAADVTVAKR